MSIVIIAGHVTLKPEERERYVAAFSDMITRARAYPGCLDVAITPDPVDSARIYILEVWDSEATLQAWRKVAGDPDVKVEFDDSAVKKYEISKVGPPF